MEARTKHIATILRKYDAPSILAMAAQLDVTPHELHAGIDPTNVCIPHVRRDGAGPCGAACCVVVCGKGTRQLRCTDPHCGVIFVDEVDTTPCLWPVIACPKETCHGEAWIQSEKEEGHYFLCTTCSSGCTVIPRDKVACSSCAGSSAVQCLWPVYGAGNWWCNKHGLRPGDTVMPISHCREVQLCTCGARLSVRRLEGPGKVTTTAECGTCGFVASETHGSWHSSYSRQKAPSRGHSEDDRSARIDKGTMDVRVSEGVGWIHAHCDACGVSRGVADDACAMWEAFRRGKEQYDGKGKDKWEKTLLACIVRSYLVRR